MSHVRRQARAALVPLAVAALFTACESATAPGPAGVPILFDRNLAVQVTDTAVVVDGAVIAGVPRTGQALWLGHETSYEYGGLGSYAPDRLWSEQRFIRFGHETREERGDTLVFTYLDFGDVALAGDVMEKATDEPDAGNAPFPVRFEGFVVYLAATYVHQTYLDGGDRVLLETPAEQTIRAGGTLDFAATGADAAAFETTVRPVVIPALTGLESGDPLDFRAERPVLRAGTDVVLTFAAAVAPDDAVILLLPWHQDVTDPATRRAATAVGRLDRAASRAVIPGTLVADLLAATGLEESGYLLYIFQFRHQNDAIATTRVDSDEPLSLPLVQTDVTRFFLRIGG